MADPTAITIEPLSADALWTIEREMERYWVPGRTPMTSHIFLHQFGNVSFVARDGHEIAGFVLGLIGTVDPKTAYVHLIATRDDYRRRGLARLLYATFRDAVTPLGATAVSAMVREDNAESIALHERLGMVAQRHEGLAGPGQDRLIFRGPVD